MLPSKSNDCDKEVGNWVPHSEVVESESAKTGKSNSSDPDYASTCPTFKVINCKSRNVNGFWTNLCYEAEHKECPTFTFHNVPHRAESETFDATCCALHKRAVNGDRDRAGLYDPSVHSDRNVEYDTPDDEIFGFRAGTDPNSWMRGDDPVGPCATTLEDAFLEEYTDDDAMSGSISCTNFVNNFK